LPVESFHNSSGRELIETLFCSVESLSRKVTVWSFKESKSKVIAKETPISSILA